MTARFIDTAVDLIWPSLDGDANEHAAQERERLDTEMQAIKQAVTKLRPNEEELKGYLAASEKLLETENSRKGGIESRLLNAAGLVSIAGTVVLGALFSLASEKLTLSAPWARITLTLGCLYLAVQLVAALHAAIKGLQARGYVEDLPHELLPRDGLKRTAYLRERVERLLGRVAEHRGINNGKLDQLNIAHCAMRNFLWGLFGVAVTASVVSLVWPPSPPAATCPNGNPCGPNTQQLPSIPSPGSQLPPGNEYGITGRDVSLPVILISAGTCITTLGIALFAAGGTSTRRIVGITMTLGGLGMSVLAGTKLDNAIFKIDKLIGELQFELSLAPPLRPQTAYYIRRLVTVGPFPDGDHSLAEEQVAQCVSSALDQYNGMRISGWEIVGRVDKRQLTTARAAIYGSNQALAMSRATWVARQFLAARPSFDLAHAVITVGGARGIGASVATNDLQSDRAVDVFALVNAGTNTNGTVDLPDPVVCSPPTAPR